MRALKLFVMTAFVALLPSISFAADTNTTVSSTVVDKAPPNESGTLESYLQKNQKQNKSYVTKGTDGKHAILDYKILKKLDNFYHLEIKPKTGRHHQIRVQLANICCIIKGDLKYGARRSNKDASIHLLAQKL